MNTEREPTTQITLSQEEIKKAVQYWMNKTILKNPCRVTSMRQDTRGHMVFSVQFDATEEEN